MEAKMIDKNLFENFIIKVMILIVASSGVTAMLSKESWSTVIKNCIAGLLAGVVGFIVSTTVNWGQSTTVIVCMVLSAFVSSIWPMIGDIARKYLKRKADDTLRNN